MARRIKSRKKSPSGAKLVTNPDFRPRTHFPLPSFLEIGNRLQEILPVSPDEMKAILLRPGLPQKRLRERVLTLPVMAVLMVTMVWRQLPSLSDALRALSFDDLWGIPPIDVSRQALSKRLQALPAELFAALYEEALSRLQALQNDPPAEPDSLQSRFSVLWAVDGSTLEALRRKLKESPDQKTPLGGKMLAVVDLLTRRPVHTWYTEKAAANDKSFFHQLLEALPVNGLAVLDLGWFGFTLFDELTAAGKFFITRMRQKTAYNVIQVLGAGSHWRDEIIEVGIHRSNPCKERLRMVSVLWGTTWYRYLTNVLDPGKLSAREVAIVYRRRWRIEEAFLLTKRLLGLSYLWVGGANGVQIQVYATWLFYAVLTDLCVQISEKLDTPLERISVEMVYRSFYHYSRRETRGYSQGIVMFISENAKILGIVKATHKRQREKEASDLKIWSSP